MAEPAKYGLNEDEVVILRGVVARVKNGTLNTGKTSDYKTDAEEQQAPEVYVVKIPEGGIDGLTMDYDDLGTGSGSPVIASHEAVPGYADCQVYVIVDVPNLPPVLTMVEGLTFLVYNLSEASLDEDAYVRVTRDKYGNWIAGTVVTPQDLATHNSPILHGTLDGTMVQDGTATLSVYRFVVAEVDYTLDVTVRDWLLSSGQTIASGSRVIAGYDGYSNCYYVIAARCP